MLRINQLRLPVGHTKEELVQAVKKLLGCGETPEIRIVRRSIDARKKPKLYLNYILNVKISNQAKIYRRCNKNQVSLWEEKPYDFPVSVYRGKIRPVIIGTGPAGLFCGYMLAQAGFCPILLERGEPVEERTKSVHTFWETGKLNQESNVQFGEGGAGTFSDGKLNTLVKDKYGRNGKVLSLLAEAGAPPEILYDYKPHIGTDKLCEVVVNLRNTILAMGGEVRFNAKVTDIQCDNEKISGVIINGKERITAEYVILAPGHSARDTFVMLYEKGLEMESKPFAVGMRVEHPQELINFSQYGKEKEETLGSAPYKVTAKTSGGRGVYSFCMCPGGYVVNASSEEGRLTVNGMSYSGRNGKNANSAIIVSVTPEDYGSSHPLAGIEFQRRLEERAFEIAGGKVPVERYGEYRKALEIGRTAGFEAKAAAGFEKEIDVETEIEFGIKGKESCDAEIDIGIKTEANHEEDSKFLISDDFAPCIKGSWAYGEVHKILPRALGEAFVEGMEHFGEIIKGFNDKNVLVEGIESRTSSPVRILRDETLQSSIKGLYPCGEGAGYAGGITSAAMDGIRVAEEVAIHIMERDGGQAYGESKHHETGAEKQVSDAQK
ncbi:MAG: FAD-dependent oxidoreductase [Clostridium sp.]|nr:FAD-dependent oxidoreductase [Clostridium sp.]